MKATHLQRGEHAEWIARKYLEKNGLKLLRHNYRCKTGEIDLIMQHGNEMVFIEVRYRKNTAFGLASETVRAPKQRKIIRTAEQYLTGIRGKIPPCRFDVISVCGTPGQESIQWIRDAFQVDG